MPYIDQFVLVFILLGISAYSIHLWRRGARRLRFFVGAWLAFYGIVLTLMMVAHSVDILYKTYMGGVARDGSPWAYNFHMYALHLLGGVLVWQGAKCLCAAQSISAGGYLYNQEALQATIVTLIVVVPLFPIQTFFTILLTVLSTVNLLVLAVGRSHEKKQHIEPAPAGIV